MPSFVHESPQSLKKVPNVKMPTLPAFEELTNIINPYKYKVGELPFSKNKFDKNIQKEPFKLPAPGEGLPRVIHYCADQSGCAFWRLIWPGDELLAHNKCVIMTLYQMVILAQFYLGIDAVRLQRQCTSQQLEFVKFLRQVTEDFKKNDKIKKGFRIILEVDDIIGPAECIPEYNVCRDAFLDPEILNNFKKIAHLCDEMTVVSENMRKHYTKYLEYDKISVIPNYAPKSWLDRGHDEESVIDNFIKHKQKPRVLYAGSGTHFDVDNRVNQKDDFAHVVDFIIKDLTVHKKYEWVFVGGLPQRLRQFINNGIEFHNWSAITEYPDLIKSLNVNAAIAPLADNAFSRSKANIKLMEYGALGIPCVAQDLDPYNSDGWTHLFTTGEQMMTELSKIVSSEMAFKKAVKEARAYAERFWLKDHLDQYSLLYTTEFGSAERLKNKVFVDNNKQQFKK